MLMAAMSAQKTDAAKGRNSQQEPKAGSVESIRAAAYQLYEKRGRQSGQELNDWLEAERMILTPKKTNDI